MGDFSAQFHRPESGIHTVEGNVAGSRAAALTKKRQREQEKFEQRKLLISRENQKSGRSIDEKFAHETNVAESAFRKKTVGLVTADEFKQAAAEKSKRNDDDDEEEEAKEEVSPQELEKQRKAAKKARKKALKQKKKAMSTLSFAVEEDEEETGNSNSATRVLKKDPTTDTSFLPDKERDDSFVAQTKKLQKEWKQQQLSIKEEQLEIVYSYWDGSGHRRTVVIKKGDTIGHFLDLVRRNLSKEFREMQSVSSDALIYVKEDLILPHDFSFYDFIVTRARGKSGPLFHFDVHDDVRVGAIDVRIEKDESHPGKVVERRWYDRNKHIFPASRWEVFDPTKDYGTYTIHGGEVTKKEK